MDSIRVAKVENVTLLKTNTRSVGTLHLTPHHLIFTASSPSPSAPTSLTSQSQSTETWIPYPHITQLTRLPLTIQNTSPLQLRTKTFECFTFVFASGRDRDAEDVWSSVKELGVVSSIDRLYAFSYRPPVPLSSTSSGPSKSSDIARVETSRRAHPNHVPLLTELDPDALPTSSATSSLQPTPVPSSSSNPPPDALTTTTTSITTTDTISTTNGWHIYSPREEFARMGVGTRTRAWRFTDVNRDYSFSPTYPAKLVVPSKISDAVLVYAGKYRSKARIPALTYLHWANQATITRCSQPLVGFKGARSPQDERLVDSIFTSHLSAESNFGDPSSSPSSGTSTPRNGQAGPLTGAAITPYGGSAPTVYGATATNLIVDARPTTNAMANVAVGAGTENMENYKAARKAYLGIDNIHVMRDSLRKVVEALKESENSPSGSIDKHALRRSNWLKHIAAIMEGSLMIVRNIHINSSHVLIHCSDGWDRTGQLSAVAQICLDPFYRTIRGFEILVEKDWMSFGHKFLDRSGHLGSEKAYQTMPQPDDDYDESVGATEKAAQAFFKSVSNKFASSGTSKEVSPVFHQFLDCVRQIQRQYPERFEYNSAFLETLMYHLYSCQFGSFIANNERQRRTAPSELEKDQEGFSANGIVWEQTAPVWDWLNEPDRLATYRNEAYDPSLDKAGAKGTDSDMGVLLPDPKDIRFWHELFHRSDDDMNGRRTLHDQMADSAIVGTVGPIRAGQEDPVAAAGPLEVARSVAAVATSESWLDGGIAGAGVASGSWHNVEALSPPARSSSSDTRLRSGSAASTYAQSPSRGAPRQAPHNGRGGWGWAQISSGALNAISVAGRELGGAAKEIKNISSEAFTSFAPGESDGEGGEMWETGNRQQDRSSARVIHRAAAGEAVDPWGNPIAPILSPPESQDQTTKSMLPPPRPGRVPSEANPWATTSQQAARASPAIPSFSHDRPSHTVTPQPRLGPRLPSNVDYMATPSSTWGSVADRKPVGNAQLNRDVFASPQVSSSVEPMTRTFAATTIDASKPEEQSKSWDPLGAL